MSVSTRSAAALLIARMVAMRVAAQGAPPPHDPDVALLVATDIPNFWKAYDARKRVSRAERLFALRWLHNEQLTRPMFAAESTS